MQSNPPLNDLIASAGHVRVLRAADALPLGFRASARDLARRAGLAHSRVLRILADLVGSGVLTVQRIGRADMYEMNRQHILYGPIHELFAREAEVSAELAGLLRRRLRSFKWVREAYVFGSIARGEARQGSDVDVAIVAPRMRAETVDAALVPLVAEVRQRFGRELSVHLGDRPAAVRARARRPGRDLWARIASEGIRLIPRSGERA